MLYDPKWEQKTDPRSLEAFIAFAETQPASRIYNFCDERDCALYHWLGIPISQYELLKMFGGRGADILMERPWTFKAAAERARKLRITQDQRGDG